jgi:hypothetical protein
MGTANVEQAREAAARQDLLGLRSALERVAWEEPLDLRYAIACRAVASEAEKALSTMPDIVAYAVECLGSREPQPAAQTGRRLDFEQLRSPDAETLATRWIVATDFADRSSQGSTTRVKHLRGARLILSPPRSRSQRGDLPARRVITDLMEQTAEFCYKEEPLGYPQMASVIYLIRSDPWAQYHTYLALLELARRLYQRRSERAATACLVAALTQREAGILGTTETWCRAALELAPEGSLEAAAATRLIRERRRERLEALVSSIDAFPLTAPASEVEQLCDIAPLVATDGHIVEAVSGLARAAQALSRALRHSEGSHLLATARTCVECQSRVESTELALEQAERAVGEAKFLQEAFAESRRDVDSVVRHLSLERRQVSQLAFASSTSSVFLDTSVFSVDTRLTRAFVPTRGWALAHAEATDQAVLLQYCVKGEALHNWTALFTVCSSEAPPHARFPDFRKAALDMWEKAALNGVVTLVDSAELSAFAQHIAGDLVDRFALTITDDAAFGCRYEFHEVWRTGRTLCILTVSIRGDDADARRAQVFASDPGVQAVFPNPQAVRTDRHQRLIDEALHHVDSARQRLSRLCQTREQEVAGALALYRATATPLSRECFIGFGDRLSETIADPDILLDAELDSRAARRRLDWVLAGTVAYALALEQLAFSLLRERHGGPASGRLVPLLVRAVSIHTRRGNATGVIRCLALLQRLQQSDVAESDSLGLRTLIDAREAFANDAAALARMDLELLFVLARTPWALSSDDLMFLAERLSQECCELAKEQGLVDIVENAEIAWAELFPRLGHPAYGRFSQRSIASILDGGPVCSFTYGPRGSLLFFRSLGSDLRLRHKMSAVQVDWVRRVAGAEVDDETVSLEGALVLGVGDLTIHSFGGAVDSVPAFRWVLPSQWKRGVRGILHHAAEVKRPTRNVRFGFVLCVVPGQSDGVLWEMSAICRFGLIADTYFIMPPDNAGDDVAHTWNRTRNQWHRATGCMFPEHIGTGGIISFDGNGGEAQVMSLDELWDGRFAKRVHAALTATYGNAYNIFCRLPDMLAGVEPLS